MPGRAGRRRGNYARGRRGRGRRWDNAPTSSEARRAYYQARDVACPVCGTVFDSQRKMRAGLDPSGRSCSHFRLADLDPEDPDAF